MSMTMQVTTSQATHHRKMELLNSPSQHCLIFQAAQHALNLTSNPLSYTFFGIYGGIIKTQITQIDNCNMQVCHVHANVLDFDDNIIGKIEADVNTALSNGLYRYV